MFGEDRLVFSVDYPFEDNREAIAWFNHLDLPHRAPLVHDHRRAICPHPSSVREKMVRGTVDQLLRLPVS